MVFLGGRRDHQVPYLWGLDVSPGTEDLGHGTEGKEIHVGAPGDVGDVLGGEACKEAVGQDDAVLDEVATVSRDHRGEERGCVGSSHGQGKGPLRRREGD